MSFVVNDLHATNARPNVTESPNRVCSATEYLPANSSGMSDFEKSTVCLNGTAGGILIKISVPEPVVRFEQSLEATQGTRRCGQDSRISPRLVPRKANNPGNTFIKPLAFYQIRPLLSNQCTNSIISRTNPNDHHDVHRAQSLTSTEQLTTISSLRDTRLYPSFCIGKMQAIQRCPEHNRH